MLKIDTRQLKNIKVEDIFPDEKQPRKHFDDFELCRLKDSIKENGIIQPLSVRRHGAGYILIAGERRLRAAKMAGMKRVPCIVYNADEMTSGFYSVIENLQRCDLSVFEEAASIARLINEYGLSHCDVAARLGIAQSTLSNKLRILRLSENIRRRIVGARLTERHARALLRVPENRQEQVLDYIIANGLTLSQSEAYIDRFLSGESEKSTDKAGDKKSAIGDIRIFGNSLTRLVETMVNAGINAKQERTERRDYIEYKIRISKDSPPEDTSSQLKIC